MYVYDDQDASNLRQEDILGNAAYRSCGSNFVHENIKDAAFSMLPSLLNSEVLVISAGGSTYRTANPARTRTTERNRLLPRRLAPTPVKGCVEAEGL